MNRNNRLDSIPISAFKIIPSYFSQPIHTLIIIMHLKVTPFLILWSINRCYSKSKPQKDQVDNQDINQHGRLRRKRYLKEISSWSKYDSARFLGRPDTQIDRQIDSYILEQEHSSTLDLPQKALLPVSVKALGTFGNEPGNLIQWQCFGWISSECSGPISKVVFIKKPILKAILCFETNSLIKCIMTFTCNWIHWNNLHYNQW